MRKIVLPLQDQIDFTGGSLYKKMLLFIIPVILTSLLQLLYSSADLFVVSRWGGGAAAMAAVGDNGSLLNLLVNTFVGVSVGANIVLAKEKGEKNKEDAMKAIRSSMFLALIISIPVALAGYFLAPTILGWMSTPTENGIREMAATYLSIYFLGVPFVLIFNFGSALLRAMGDSKRPLYALALCGSINLALNFLFVLVFHLGVAGVAYTTVISEALEALLVVLFLRSKKNTFARLTFSWPLLDKKESGKILRNGLPSGLETLVFSISNVVIQAAANHYASLLPGSTASDNIEGYIFIVLEAFAVSVSTIASENLGAGNEVNLRKTLSYSIISIVGLGIILGGLAVVFRYQLIKIFLVEGDDHALYEASLEAGASRLLLMGLTYWICALMDCFSGYYRGLGHSIIPTIVIIVCALLFRLVFVYCIYGLIPSCHNFLFLYSSYPMSWALAVLVDLFLLRPFTKKAHEEIAKRPSLVVVGEGK